MKQTIKNFIICTSIVAVGCFCIYIGYQYCDYRNAKEMADAYDEYNKVMLKASKKIDRQHEQIDSLYNVIDSLSNK